MFIYVLKLVFLLHRGVRCNFLLDFIDRLHLFETKAIESTMLVANKLYIM